MRGRVACGIAAAGLLLTVAARADNASTAADLNNQAIAEGKAHRVDQGVALLRQALTLSPHDPVISRNLSMALADWAWQRYREGGATDAIPALEEAIQHDPKNGHALVALGNLYYLSRNEFAQAIEMWKRAYGLIPTSQWQAVSERIAQAERDQGIERRFATYTTPHFHIRVPSSDQQAVAERLGTELEAAYTRLSSEWGSSPTDLTVIVYAIGDFQRLAAKPDWAIGFYDGRVRIRLDDVGTDRESRILLHELAHAFLHKICGGGIPIWVHEGYAQAVEPSHPRTDREREVEQGVRARTAWVPLKWLDAHFEQPTDARDVDRAYAEARVIVEFLLHQYGFPQLRRFVSAVASGRPVAAAFEESFPDSHWARFDQGLPE